MVILFERQIQDVLRHCPYPSVPENLDGLMDMQAEGSEEAAKALGKLSYKFMVRDRTILQVYYEKFRLPAINAANELARCGVRISLGHSMATYTQTKAAIAEGLTGFTHLFNAMRPLGSRDPGPIAAALESPVAYVGMIVDGEHVAPEMLRLALRGAARPMLITDAMPPVGGQSPSFKLYGQEIFVRDGRCLRADGTLAGAALDMASAVRNTVRDLDVPLTSALRFASTEPAEFLGLGTMLGRIDQGFRADMVAFEPSSMDVLDTWVAGHAATHKARH